MTATLLAFVPAILAVAVILGAALLRRRMDRP